jgi:uncharacterized protein (DUF1778 family)
MDPRTERITIRLTRSQAILLAAMALAREVSQSSLASDFVVSCIEEYEARQAREKQVMQAVQLGLL